MGDRHQQPRRHPHRVLSARAVQTAKGTGRVQRIADGGGLYLLIAPSGSKSWLLRTVVKGKRCDLGLGSVSLVPLAEARDEAVRLRKIARANSDGEKLFHFHSQSDVDRFVECLRGGV